MDKKNNMKQAVYEMFGVGSAPAEKAGPSAQSVQLPDADSGFIPEETNKAPVQPVKKESEKAVVVPPDPQPRASYLAPGTVMEGTLRCVGDVEIAGDFKGDITTQGTVILHANIQGNLTVSSLNLAGCKLVGDVVADGLVTVSESSEICGNVTAKELCCGGRIAGDLKIAENTALERSAKIHGNIRTGTISVARGAVIKGRVETGEE